MSRPSATTGQHSGMANLKPWPKGVSGNPSGGSKIQAELRARAKIDSPEAYDVIVRMMRDADKDSTRLQAAVRVLQIAGVTFNADVNLTVREAPADNPYAARPTDDLLSQASTSLAQ